MSAMRGSGPWKPSRRLAGLGLTLRLKPFVRLARTLREHRDGILAAIRLGLSNGRLEGLNSEIRLISHRASGFHRPRPTHRAHLPLLQRPDHRTPAMNFTPTRTMRRFWRPA